MATIVEREDFDPEELCKQLRKAMKGFGTDEEEIIEVLTSVNNAQRQELKHTFKSMYGRDLMDDLKSELGGNLEDAVRALMRTPAEYDAWSLREAMKGAGTDEETIAEILASRSNEEIAAIREAFQEKYDRDLEEDIESEASGHLKRIFISLLQGNRDESEEVDEDKAQADAQALYDAGEDAWGTDESEFNRVFMTTSPAQLRATCDAYREISDYDLSKAIKKEMGGDLEFAFLAILACARDPAKFLAERAHRALKGIGTDDEALIRVIVSSSEKNLQDVAEAYIDKYEKSLKAAVKDDCGGKYEKLLLAILK